MKVLDVRFRLKLYGPVHCRMGTSDESLPGMLIEFRQLEYFIATAEELHFGRAASRVHVTPSALSEQIKQMEELMEVRLFSRTTRTVRLTAAGKLFLEHARMVLLQAELGVRLARSVSRGEMAAHED